MKAKDGLGSSLRNVMKDTVHFPSLSGRALDICMRFSAHYVEHGAPPPDPFFGTCKNDFLLDIALASSFLQNLPLISAVGTALSSRRLAAEDIEMLPDDVFYEMVLTAPFPTIVRDMVPFLTEERACMVCQARWVLPPSLEHQAHSVHHVSQRPTPTLLSPLDSESSTPLAPGDFRSVDVIRDSPASEDGYKPACVSLKSTMPLVSPYCESRTISRPMSDVVTAKSLLGSEPNCMMVRPPTRPKVFPYTDRGGSNRRFWRSLLYQLMLQHELTAAADQGRLKACITTARGVGEFISNLAVRNDNPVVVSAASALAVWTLALSTLDVSRANLGPTGALALTEALKGNTTVTRLNIGNNKLRAEGAGYLGDMLAANATLRTLHAEHNAMGPHGAVDLAHGLVSNTTLTKLAVGYNQFQARGVTALANALTSNTALVVLDAANNYSGDEGAQAMARLVETNRTLQVIRMWDSSVSVQGGLTILEAVTANTSLTEVGLGMDSLDSVDRATLIRHCDRNRRRLQQAGKALVSPGSPDTFGARRIYERDLLYGSDTVFSDTWYLIDERWLALWREFVARDSKADPPGPISNDTLLRDNAPRPGLRKLFDYRGVHPRVWSHFHRIYGGGPVIRRSKIDIYCEDSGIGLKDVETDTDTSGTWPNAVSDSDGSDSDGFSSGVA
ncbi:DUSP domain [Carpediemonas membranifera]|uniref:DUSP domain n=1 Tax=Carpediemonas membranifera TaxID=201153 RepID=A0A8J6B3G2_9EUKA|nr:DUSP domain [Carpediemonas membranifera]|eukprot:KAG9394908.1 DUSP domain [Carpediemonas membranifera]